MHKFQISEPFSTPFEAIGVHIMTYSCEFLVKVLHVENCFRITYKNSKFKHKQLEKKRFQGHRLHRQRSEELYKVINNVVEVVDEKSSKPTN